MGEERSKRYVEICHLTDEIISVRVRYASNSFIVYKTTRDVNLRNMKHLLYSVGDGIFVKKEKLEEFKGLLTLNNFRIKEVYL